MQQHLNLLEKNIRLAKCPPWRFWRNVRWRNVRWRSVGWRNVRWRNVMDSFCSPVPQVGHCLRNITLVNIIRGSQYIQYCRTDIFPALFIYLFIWRFESCTYAGTKLCLNDHYLCETFCLGWTIHHCNTTPMWGLISLQVLIEHLPSWLGC